MQEQLFEEEGNSASGLQLQRLLEAVIFAADKPVTLADLQRFCPDEGLLRQALASLQAHYEGRGITLQVVGEGWIFLTATDLQHDLGDLRKQSRKLSRAACETLAIIAYHQPITRAEIEQIRGVAISRGSFDQLLEANWITPLGRQETPGRPMAWGTTTDFLLYFGLSGLDALPNRDELKAAGLLDRKYALQQLAMDALDMGQDSDAAAGLADDLPGDE